MFMTQFSFLRAEPGHARAALGLALGPLTLACLLASGGMLATGASAQALLRSAPVMAFDVPAQSLQDAVNVLARQSGVSIAADAQALAGKQAPAVRGHLTLDAALRQLLAGSGLEATEQGAAVVLRPRAAAGASALAEVTVKAGASSAETLPEVYAGGQVAQGARLGLLGNVDLMDTPFSVMAYTEQTIADQQAKTVADVLKNDPSVRFTTSDNHNAEWYVIRGYEVASYELALNGLYGLLPSAHTSTEFIERVEVFKGPAAMLSGIAPSSSIGGVINIVPKRAGEQDLNRVTASYSSQSQLGLAADVARRFGAEKRLGVRVNGSYNNGKTSLDDQKKRSRFGSLGLDYRGVGWNAALDVWATNQDQANGSPLMVGFGRLGHVIEAPDASKNALRGTFANQTSTGIAARGEYEINRNWSVYAAAGAARYWYQGYLNGTRVIVLNDAGDAQGQTYGQVGYTHGVSAETGLRGHLRTGAVDHQLVLSASVQQKREGSAPSVTSTSYITNIYQPLSTPNLASFKNVNKTADNTFTSLSLADTLGFWEGRVALTLGARAQRVRTRSWNATSLALSGDYDESAVTPAVGLVVKPWGPNLALYGNYIEGLSVGTTPGADLGSYTHTFSLFQIRKPSAVDEVRSSGTYLVADGEQRNTGLEWHMFGQLLPQVRVLGGVAYTRAEQSRASKTDNNGRTAPGVPKWTANLGAEWSQPWLSGLVFDGRATYTSAQYLDAANTLEIPSWVRWDAGARYATRIAGKAVVLRGEIINLLDRNYYSGRFGENYATLGSPRTFKLSASVDF
jgi:iron complex outermembrane receptor protein